MKLSIGEVLNWLVAFGIIGFLVLLFTGKLLRPIELVIIRPASALWSQQEVKSFFKAVLAIGVIVAVVSVCYGIYSEADESGWVPHTKVVTVHMKTFSWIVGEYKDCYSTSAQPVQGITDLLCDDASEAHDLEVTFRGKDDAERDQTWNCNRHEDSLTCTLKKSPTSQVSTPSAPSDDTDPNKTTRDWTSKDEPPGRINNAPCPEGYLWLRHRSGTDGYMRHLDCVPPNFDQHQ